MMNRFFSNGITVKCFSIMLLLLFVSSGYAQRRDNRRSQPLILKTVLDRKEINTIRVSSSINLYIHKSASTSANRVEIRASKRYMDKVIAEINSDNELKLAMTEISDADRRKEDVKVDVTVYLADFNAINASGSTDVIIKDRFTLKSLYLRLSGSSDFENKLPINIDGNLSVICSGSSDLALKNIKVTSSADISTAGSSDVIIKDINIGESININSAGSSDLTLYGNALGDKVNYIKSAGSSDINTKQFLMKNANIIASGASDMYVNVTDKIDFSVSGSASIFYKKTHTLVIDRVGGNKSGKIKGY